MGTWPDCPPLDPPVSRSGKCVSVRSLTIAAWESAPVRVNSTAGRGAMLQKPVYGPFLYHFMYVAYTLLVHNMRSFDEAGIRSICYAIGSII